MKWPHRFSWLVATLLCLDICEVSSYHTSTNSKHLNTCLAMSQNTHTAETVSEAPRPVRLPRRKTDVMTKGQVVIQGLCNEDIGIALLCFSLLFFALLCSAFRCLVRSRSLQQMSCEQKRSEVKQQSSFAS